MNIAPLGVNRYRALAYIKRNKLVKHKKYRTMKTQAKFGKWGLMLATLFIALSTSSCKEGFIYEGEGDCGVYYNIEFKYDYNMKYADAFAKEVNSVTLCVFDSNDTLVDVIVEQDKTKLAAEKFSMALDLEAGSYELLAWAGLEMEESFDLLTEVEVGKTTKQDMQVMLKSVEGVVSEDLKPLFHGTMPLNVTDEPGTYTETMSLVKDTNVVRIMLQQMSDGVVAEKFRYEITADNGMLDWDNSLISDNNVLYQPWSVTSGTAEVAPDYGTNAATRADQVSVAIAEFTINRMIEGQSPILTIWNIEENERVLSIPLADYALLVKGQYNANMSNQEYLDRQDEYSMTFFLDEDGDWLSASIIVNSWRVVLNNDIL